MNNPDKPGKSKQPVVTKTYKDKNGKVIKTEEVQLKKSSINEALKYGGNVGAKKMAMGGTAKKYATGGRVVPTVDNSMSKGGKVMAKKSMGGKVAMAKEWVVK